MARLPVGKDHDARAEEAEDADYGDAVFQGIFDCAVGEIESLTPACTEDAGGFISFTGALIGCAAGSGFTLSEIENGGTQAARSHAQERTPAGLFHVVAVSCDGQDIGSEVRGLGGHRNQ
jgi:hypothetical protein